MMKIEELTSNALRIVCGKSSIGKIAYFIMGSALLALAIYVAGWGWREKASGEYAAFAPLFLVLLGVGSLIGAVYFFLSIFDRSTFNFDKASDRFLIQRRRAIFKRNSNEGPVNGITSVSCEVKGSDENTFSEIYLTYRDGGVVTETLRCGTGEPVYDEAIADTIKTFLKN